MTKSILRIATPVLLLCVLVLMPILSSSTAQATRLRPLTLSQIVSQANSIVVATVLSAERTEGGQRLPHTSYRLDIEQQLKGTGKTPLAIHFFGTRQIGQSKPTMSVPGMPAYQAGDHVLLFLTAPSELGFSSPVGLSQGSYKIRAGEQSDEIQISPLLVHNDALLTPSERAHLLTGTVPLATLTTIIEHLLQRQGGQQ